MAQPIDPVLAAFAECGSVSAVADRLGFSSEEDARQAIHAALRRSDEDIRAAGLGHLLDINEEHPARSEEP